MRIAILGGGQLARIMALAGLPLGFRFDIADPAADACAATLGRFHQAAYDDLVMLDDLADNADLATFDFENVPQAAARYLADKIPFHPTPEALEYAQDRLLEKQLFNSLDIPTAEYHPVSSRTDLLAAIEKTGYPAVLKTRRLGYDGKGQFVLEQAEDLERAWQQLGDFELILEQFIKFDGECSMIGVRGRDGETRFWPLSRNHHRQGVLSLSIAPFSDVDLQAAAQQLCSRLMDHFDYTGVLSLELFFKDGHLLANELAPRVHNSGHWTIEGAACSQFENHLRAIAGLPLGDTGALGHSLMVNWIGALPDRQQALSIPGVHWHDYGKAARPGRKMGHATVHAETREQRLASARRLATLADNDLERSVDQLLG